MLPNQTKKEYLASYEKKPDYSKDLELKRIIKEESLKVIKEYLKAQAFTERKITDTPTDNLSVVNRSYTNLNGTLANRPSSVLAVVGQKYFATDTGIPMVFSGSNWRDGVGSIVAQA